MRQPELTAEEFAELIQKFRDHEISDEQRERQEKYREKHDSC